jgi:hypothetical protein
LHPAQTCLSAGGLPSLWEPVSVCTFDACADQRLKRNAREKPCTSSHRSQSQPASLAGIAPIAIVGLHVPADFAHDRGNGFPRPRRSATEPLPAQRLFTHAASPVRLQLNGVPRRACNRPSRPSRSVGSFTSMGPCGSSTTLTLFGTSCALQCTPLRSATASTRS